MRPLLTPALRRLQRDTGTVQLGVTPGKAVLLEFQQPDTARILDLLDGSRTLPQLRRAVEQQGLPLPALETLLDHLTQAGLLRDGSRVLPDELPPKARPGLLPEARALALRTEPATVLRRRWHSSVLVSGEDRLAVPIAAGLVAAGVGQIRTSSTGVVTWEDTLVGGLSPMDRGRGRALAAAEALRRAAPEYGNRPLPNKRVVDFAILIGHARQPPELIALAHARRRIPHLVITIRDGQANVGPMIRPGETACLSCLEKFRTELDPHWPVLRAQLATTSTNSEPCETALAALVTGYAVVQVLTHLDGGRPETLGTTVEWDQLGQAKRRKWKPHPACNCIRGRGGRQSRARPGRMVE